MNVKTTALTLVSAVFLSNFVAAQAPVVDRVVSDQNSTPDQSSAVRNNYLEIQALREEISSLRGLIEEMNYELRKVQRRQDEDYQDLDKRLSSGSLAPIDPETRQAIAVANAPGGTSGSAATTVSGQATFAQQDGVDELYRSGFNALRDGNRAEAVRIFDELVEKYPGSNREADALYWLGETHWLNLEIEQSRQSFTRLLDAYPGYRKSSDAQYRLGLIYSQLGDTEKALQYMRALAEGGSTQAAPAKTYLEEQGAL